MKKKDIRAFSLHLPDMVGKPDINWEREPSAALNLLAHLESSPRLQPLQNCENKCLWFKSPSQWYCVIAVQAKTNNNSKFTRITYTIWETFLCDSTTKLLIWTFTFHRLWKLNYSISLFSPKFYDHFILIAFHTSYIYIPSLWCYSLFWRCNSAYPWIKYL